MEVRRRNKPGQGRKKDIINLEKRRALGYGDVLEPEEIDEIIARAEQQTYMKLSGEAWACLFAVFWAYGKRISEVIELRTTDLAIRGDELAVTFTIRKKVKHTRRGVKIPREEWKRAPRMRKLLKLENKYAQRIKVYWESIKDQGGYLFPGINTKMGHIYAKYVWDVIQKMGFKQPIWSHLFRHTLATELAERKVSPFVMKSWFDWSSIIVADAYVSAAGVGMEDVSRRDW